MTRRMFKTRSTAMEILENLRDAGMVKRMHTIPTLHQNTVGQHVYGAMVVVRNLAVRNGRKVAPLLEYILFHDAAELETGDVPAPTKRAIDGALDTLEHEFNVLHNIDDSGAMETIDYDICKAADIIDLGFYCLHERRSGNRHWRIDRMMSNVMRYLAPYMEKVQGVNEFINHLNQEYADASA